MANRNFTDFNLKSPANADFLVGYNAAGTTETRTTIGALVSSYATTAALNAASGVLLPTSVYQSASGSFATNTTLNSASSVLLRTSVYQSASGSFATSTALNAASSVLLRTSIYSAASGNWQSTYSLVNTNSSNWQASYEYVNQNYENWDGVYTHVRDVSSNWFEKSGGSVTGSVIINNNLTIWGNLSASGTTTFANTVFSTTSALSVYHVGSGPAMWVGNNGTGDIASFYDIDQEVEVLHVGGNNGTFPNVGVKTSQPNKDFTVVGEISATSHITTSGKFYGEGSSITNAVVTGKTIYVDANTGTDTRGTLSKYSAGSPFATIDAAVAASVTGDLVYVRAGTYTITSQINLNLKGNLFFETGATVQVAPGVVAFSYSQNSVPISIRGNADFVLTWSNASTTAGLLKMLGGNSATTVQFECNSIIGPSNFGTLGSGGGIMTPIFECNVGVLSVDAKVIQFLGNNLYSTAFIITGTGRVTARVPFVYCGRFLHATGQVMASGATGAQCNSDIWTLITYNTDSGMFMRNIGTQFRIVNYTHYGSVVFDWTENTADETHFFNGVRWISAAGSPHMTFASSAEATTKKIIFLRESNILRGSNTNSLSASVPVDVWVQNSYATVGANNNVYFKVGLFTVDPLVANM